MQSKPLKDRIDLADMVRRSNEMFARLSPEEKAAHRRAQRRSWVIGEMLIEHPEMTREHAAAIYNQVTE